MNTETSNSSKKIEEALHLLNEAAKEKRDEIKNIVSDKYTHFREALDEIVDDKKDALLKAGKIAAERWDESREFVEDVAKDVDKEVKKNPWPYIAGSAAAALLIGYILGSSRK